MSDIFNKYLKVGNGMIVLADDDTDRLFWMHDYEGHIPECRAAGKPDKKREKNNPLCETYETDDDNDRTYAEVLRLLYKAYKAGKCTEDDYIHLQFMYPPTRYGRSVLKRCGIKVV